MHCGFDELTMRNSIQTYNHFIPFIQSFLPLCHACRPYFNNKHKVKFLCVFITKSHHSRLAILRNNPDHLKTPVAKKGLSRLMTTPIHRIFHNIIDFEHCPGGRGLVVLTVCLLSVSLPLEH